MADQGTINWPGKSGKEYKYWIYPIGTSFKTVPGNYIFAKESAPNKWKPIYVGETDNLSRRLDNPDSHEKMNCIRRNGGTHVHVHESANDVAIRQQEEKDIIEKWNPPCNLEV